MAWCCFCKSEMTRNLACVENPVHVAGSVYRPVPYGDEPGMRGVTERCGDCGVEPGAVHHHGCDLEDCPRCGGQMISCYCPWDGEDYEYDEDEDFEFQERFDEYAPY